MNKKRQTPQGRRRGGGVLLLITGFFLASGLLRLGGGAGSAIAREIEALSQEDKAEMAHEPMACESAEGLGDLLASLKTREERVATREVALANRMQALAVAEVGVEQHLEALIKAERKLAATMASANTAAEDDLARLTSVYENMKSKDAAALFEEMDPEFSAGFLGRMRPDAAAAVMAGLSPPKAYSISVILAGRNALVPTE